MPLMPVDVRIEEHKDSARKKIVTVPVYRLKLVEKKKPVLLTSGLSGEAKV